MDPVIKQLWTSALRSGKYKQGKNYLNIINANNEHQYCCLGVLCEIAIKQGMNIETEEDRTSVIFASDNHIRATIKYEGDECTPPPAVQQWAGIGAEGGYIHPTNDDPSLVRDNDSGKTFDEIADIIDKHF